MKTPFSTEQFFSVLEKYNTSVFPMQLIFLAAGLFLLFWIRSAKNQNSKLPGIFVGLLWLWMGIGYHYLFFTTINKAAWLFGSLFVLQGIFILTETLIRNHLVQKSLHKNMVNFGLLLIIYGLLIYPAVSYFSEGSLTSIISAGLPCPTTILTFGLFLIYSGKFPRYLLIIPTLWSVIGISAALNFGVYQDFVMVAAAIVVNLWLFRRKPGKTKLLSQVNED